MHQFKTSWLSIRVATKIIKDFGGMLCKEFIIGWEPVSIVHYTRPETCMKVATKLWIQYQQPSPKIFEKSLLQICYQCIDIQWFYHMQEQSLSLILLGNNDLWEPLSLSFLVILISSTESFKIPTSSGFDETDLSTLSGLSHLR